MRRELLDVQGCDMVLEVGQGNDPVAEITPYDLNERTGRSHGIP